MAKLQNWDDKKGIYIEDDLTREEREVQAKLRKIVHENRKEGKRTKVGYYKLCMEEKWRRWNERRERTRRTERELLRQKRRG